MTSSSGRTTLSGIAAVLLLLGAMIFSGCSDSDSGTGPAADETDPTVSLSASPSLLMVEGNVVYTAVASDNEGVTEVEFYDENSLVGTDDTTPYTYTASYGEIDNGEHECWAIAKDAAGNTGSSDTIEVIVAINVSAELINGDFTDNADGWTLYHLTGANGWTDEAGNPPGCFRLNEYGNSEIDPGIQQDVTGFVPGLTYEITGEYRPYVEWIGSPFAESFVVTVDSVLVGSFARGPNGLDWSPFAAEFTATSFSHVIGFWGEHLDDSSFELDNVLLLLKSED